MRRAALAGALLASLIVTAPAAADPYVVTLRDDVTGVDATVDALQHSVGFTSRVRYAAALKGFAADLSTEQVDALRASSVVDSIDPDTVQAAAGTPVPVAAGDLVPAGVRRVGGVVGAGTHPAAHAAVAILDTGLDLGNPDLNAVAGANCVNPGSSPRDDNGHGTHVAGIVAARDDGRGVVGVAPGTRVYAVKVLNSRNAGTLSQLLCGINWVAANASALNIRVANLSVAAPGANDNNCGRSNKDAEHRAICGTTNLGVTFVAAAGNGGRTFARTIPAAYPEVLTATAMNDTDGAPGRLGGVAACRRGERDDVQASYSNYPGTAAEAAHVLAAPGTCVVSDRPGGGLATYFGTSQAAPHVAGAVALCLDGPCAGLPPSQVIQRVRSDSAAADTLETGFIGDPLVPVGRRPIGWLVRAGGY